MTNEMSQAETEIREATKNRDNAYEAKSNYLKACKVKRNEEFIANGGCKTCDGSGRILTWSTLDGPSWNEYGPCDNPACTAKTIGANPSLLANPFTPSEQQVFDGLESNFNNLEAVHAEIENKWTPTKGKRVRVIAQRRKNHAPIGSEGIIFWVGESTWHSGYRGATGVSTTKIGFKDTVGNTFWTTGKSVVLTDTNVVEADKFVLVGELKRYSNSGAAVLIRTEKDEIWMPLSQMKKVNDITWVIPKWLAEKNGLTV